MAVTTTPTYPVAGEAVAIATAEVVTDLLVFELTSVPDESALTLGLIHTGLVPAPTSAFEIAQAERHTDTFTPDVPGEYGVRVLAFRLYTGAGAAERRIDLVQNTTGTVEVGAQMLLPIVTAAGHGGTLRLQVNASTVRAAEFVDETGDVGRAAALVSGVTTLLAALVGQTVSAMGTDLQAAVNDYLTQYEAHRVLLSSVHANADGTNTVDRGPADSQEDAIDLLRKCHSATVAHLADSASAGTNWHTAGVDDGKNVIATAPPTTLAEATVVLCDLRWRAYNRHRLQIASPAAHGASGDTTNLIAVAQSGLDDLIIAYLDELVALAATAPAGEPDGAVEAEHTYGFTRE